jgi:hypothetical protein
MSTLVVGVGVVMMIDTYNSYLEFHPVGLCTKLTKAPTYKLQKSQKNELSHLPSELPLNTASESNSDRH